MAADWRRQRWEKVGGLAAVTVALLALLGATTAPRAAGAVYWANDSDAVGPGTIGRVNLDGTGFDPDFIDGASDPCGVALNDQRIYWANRNAPSSIGRARLDGGGVDQTFIEGGLGVPCGPSVNDQYIYWANFFGGAGNDGSIGRANLDGSGVSADNVSGSVVSNPLATAMDADFVYWSNTDQFNAPVEPSVYRQEIDSGPPGEVFTISNPLLFPAWLSLSPTRLFFGISTFGVNSTDRDGDNADSVTSANAAGGTAVHGGKIYWLSQPEGNLSRANFDGSSPEFTVISGLDNPRGLAIDDRRFPPFEFGALRRKRRRGTATLVVLLPEEGRLVLAGKGVKRRVFQAPEGRVKLRIRPKPRAREKLEDTGRARVRAKITHTPDGGEPGTRAKPIRLIQL
jgi:hypothetical protein